MTEVQTGFTLRPLGGESAEREFRYDGARVGLGRSPENECCCAAPEDRTVSHRHCEILHVNGRFELTDCSSMNGTFVNNRRIDRAQLVDGDIIGLGRDGPRLRFGLAGGAADSTKVERHTTQPSASVPAKSRRSRGLLLLLACSLVGTIALLIVQQQRIDDLQGARPSGAAATHAHGLATLVLAQPVSGGAWLHTELAPVLIADHNLVLVAGVALADARRRLTLGGGRLLVAPDGKLQGALPVRGVHGLGADGAALLQTESGLPLADAPRFAADSEPVALFWRLGQEPRLFNAKLDAEGRILRSSSSEWCWGLLLAGDGIAGLGAGPAAPTLFVSGAALGTELSRSRGAPLHALP